MFVDIGPFDELKEGRPKLVQVAGREVGVIRWQDEVFALRNICPHQYGPVCGGHAMPLIVAGDDGEIDIDDSCLVVVCPWHGWEFDARTGRAAWGEAAYRLKVYPAKVERGRVLVDAGSGEANPRRVHAGRAGA
jgi:3-phenylpropionate/trans-cinnamate dioxygenase ferredoxin subunit